MQDKPMNFTIAENENFTDRFLNSKLKLLFKKIYFSWAPVAHACNPSYSGGNYPEDCSSKPTPVNSS
jgi:hypothetical protein